MPMIVYASCLIGLAVLAYLLTFIIDPTDAAVIIYIYGLISYATGGFTSLYLDRRT